MMRFATVLLIVAAGFAQAQEQTSTGSGAVLRVLDKVNGQTTDIDLSSGEVRDFGRLQIELDECRFPEGNPSGDSFAHVIVRERDKTEPIFSGWLIETAPALNAVDHPRYDVWVMHCNT